MIKLETITASLVGIEAQFIVPETAKTKHLENKNTCSVPHTKRI